MVFADFPETVEACRRGWTTGTRTRPRSTPSAAGSTRCSESDLRDERERCRKRVIGQSEALAAHNRALMGQVEALLAGHIARDLGDRPGDVRPHMIASAVIGALAWPKGGDDGESPPTEEEAGAMVDDALRFLQGGLEALSRS